MKIRLSKQVVGFLITNKRKKNDKNTENFILFIF